MLKLTKYIFRWHHWCGLIVGIFLLMMSITGSLLVFSEEWELLEEKPVYISSGAGDPGFDASLGFIQNRYPGWEIRMYHLPEKNQPLVYELRQKEKRIQVWTDPVNGNLLAVNEKANKAFHRQLLLLHYTLFSGTTGKIIVFFYRSTLPDYPGHRPGGLPQIHSQGLAVPRPVQQEDKAIILFIPAPYPWSVDPAF